MTIFNNVHMLFNRPDEIVKEIYSERTKLNNENNFFVKNNNSEDFDSTLGSIVNIIVSYDMGWSKRGNGKSYDSLNGYGAIIGFLSGKILDYQTRNRKCRMCDNGHPAETHDCRKNYSGSAKSMEASVGAELILNSKILKTAKVCARVFIGDEDAKTAKDVQQRSPVKIFKLCDQNHLNKNFSKDLYAVQPIHKELKKKE